MTLLIVHFNYISTKFELYVLNGSSILQLELTQELVLLPSSILY